MANDLIAANDTIPARWTAVVRYRCDGGRYVDVIHDFEEIEELHDLVERGPHWETIIDITVRLARADEDIAPLTIEQAAQL